MNSKHFLYLSIVFFVLSFFGMSVTENIKDEKKGVKRAQEVFLKKEALVKKNFLRYNQAGFESAINSRNNLIEQGISILVYKNDSLVFWSDNSIPISSIHVDTIENNSRISILYSSYYCITDTLESRLFVGMILLSSNFPYQNKFLINGVDPAFRLAEGVKIVSSVGEKTYPIINGEGSVVFYLDFTNAHNKSNTGFSLFATAFFFLGVFFLLNFFRVMLKQVSDKKVSLLLVYVFVGLFAGRVILLFTGVLNNQFLLFVWPRDQR